MAKRVPRPGALSTSMRPLQGLHDEVVDDVQPEPRAALLARGREERVEDPRPIWSAGMPRPSSDTTSAMRSRPGSRTAMRSVPRLALGEAVHGGVDDEVGEHLAQRAGIGLDGEALGAVDLDGEPALAQHGAEAGQQFVQPGAQLDGAALAAHLVGGDLLEALHEVRRRG